MDSNELLLLLGHSSSAKRRSAAKKLRKLKDKKAVPALIEALNKEIKSAKTWETQYHMIMALGEIKDKEALNFLYSLSKPNDLAYMVNVAIGDSITRLEHSINSSYETLELAIKNQSEPIAEGAIRAIAMLHAVPNNSIIHNILDFVDNPKLQHIHFWVAAAAATWKDQKVIDFLNLCLNSTNKDTIKAAKASLQGKYLKWNPL